VTVRDDSRGSEQRRHWSGLEIAQTLHAQAARGHSGVLLLRPLSSEGEARRIGLRSGWVYALDAGPTAPVTAEGQLRYLLRQRSQPEFQPTATLSGRFAVEEFRPDSAIRQHVEAQQLPPEPLRQRIGSQRIAVVAPLHASALHVEEQALLRFLAEPRTVPELLDHGARTAGWSPLRALRLLVVCEALGTLLIGAVGGAVAAAYALLGLDATATPGEVKLAYRRLARSLHPDSHPELAASDARALTDRFTAVHAAYRLLLLQGPVHPDSSG
jgi:hypothetical protein